MRSGALVGCKRCGRGAPSLPSGSAEVRVRRAAFETSILRSALMGACLQAMLVAPTFAAQTVDLSRSEIREIVESLDTAIVENYVFEDKARHASEFLKKGLQAGAYDSITSKSQLAGRLTEDLVEVTADLHSSVSYDTEGVERNRDDREPGETVTALGLTLGQSRLQNFGFEEVKVLAGNVGYIRFGYFADPAFADEVAASAMRFVENTEALIFDVRYNRGGVNEMGQFLSSYLYAHDADVRFYDYYEIRDGRRAEGTAPMLGALPGVRMPEVPVYVLTSSATFSAAEWFAYSLQKLERAEIVGQRSSGAAHAVAQIPFHRDFILQIAVGELRDPIDDGHFEGVGVVPDHEVPSRSALAKAHELALLRLAAKDPERQGESGWLLPAIHAEADPPRLSPVALQRAVGEYEGRSISLSNGRLTYHWSGRFSAGLEPLSRELFAVEGVQGFRFRLVEEDGEVSALERVMSSGETTRYRRID